MKRNFSVLALTLASFHALAEEKLTPTIDVLGHAAIPHFAVGGPQWQTTFVFHNPSSSFEKFSIQFLGDDGQPLPIPLLGGMYSSLLVELPPHYTKRLISDYRPDLSILAGSALITRPSTCGDCRFSQSTVHTIFALFDWQKRTFVCEATVPQERDYYRTQVLVYDQEEGYVMGVALMNPDASNGGLVTASVYDSNNRLLKTERFSMGPLTHRAFVLSERYPETVGKLGYVRFSINIGNLAELVSGFHRTVHLPRCISSRRKAGTSTVSPRNE